MRALGAVAAGGMFATTSVPGSARGDWKPVADAVREEYLWAWHQYVERALGADHIKPISGGREDFFVEGHSVGLSLVEAVDTLWLMEADAEVAQAVQWSVDELDFDIDAPFQVFETNIRMVGGSPPPTTARVIRVCSKGPRTSPTGCCRPSPNPRPACPTAT